MRMLLQKRSQPIAKGLLCLPPETLIKIILFLPAKDILSFTKCCITIAEITKLDIIWEKKSQQEFCVKSKNNTNNNTKILSESNLHSLQNKYLCAVTWNLTIINSVCKYSVTQCLFVLYNMDSNDF